MGSGDCWGRASHRRAIGGDETKCHQSPPNWRSRQGHHRVCRFNCRCIDSTREAGVADCGIPRPVDACVELAKDWRTDKYLRKLDAMMIVSDHEVTFMLTGNGDVLEPTDGVAAIGSGGSYALAAARALIDQPNMDAEEIARKSMLIASDLCVFTNNNLVVETIDADVEKAEADEKK